METLRNLIEIDYLLANETDFYIKPYSIKCKSYPIFRDYSNNILYADLSFFTNLKYKFTKTTIKTTPEESFEQFRKIVECL